MERARKRRKLVDSSTNDSLERIKDLEVALKKAITEHTSLNALADLVAITTKASDEPETLHKALYANYRVFSLLINGKRLEVSKGLAENEVQIRQWLQQRLERFMDVLNTHLHHKDDAIKSAALKILLSFVKQTSSALSLTSGHPQLHLKFFRQATRLILSDETICNPFVRDLFFEEWLDKFDDVRFFVLRDVSWRLKSAGPNPSQELVSNCLTLLERIQTMPTKQADLNAFFIEELAKKPSGKKDQKGDLDVDDDANDDWRKFFEDDPKGEPDGLLKEDRLSAIPTREALHSVMTHKVIFSYAWHALLQHVKTSKDSSKRVLNILHRSILPHLIKPERLMDWIGACVDFGGAIALLALNALFVLIRDHNLDYPDFYTRLYGVLDEGILHVRYRARFFRLLELFLSSTHLPAVLLASFAKRLCRLSLQAPPAAIIMTVPFVYNILKRHPVLMTMIHRDTIGEHNDPFLPQEPSPLQTNAIDSSLWELYNHRNHYIGTVSTLVKVFSDPFSKPSYILEDFLDHTYSTMYVTESQRKTSKEPAMHDALGNNGILEQMGATVDRPQYDLCSLWATE